MLRESLAALTAAITVLFVVPAQAVTLGQSEDFQSGLANWSGGAWVNTGGPTGQGDAFLNASTSIPSVISVGTRTWDGDYVAAGVNAVEADMINLGASDLTIRFHFYGYGSGRFVSASPLVLAPGQGWQHLRFGLSASDLTPDPAQALHDVTIIGFTHQVSLQDTGGTPVVGSLGVDNIRLTPEPASLSVFLGVSAVLTARGRDLRTRLTSERPPASKG